MKRYERLISIRKECGITQIQMAKLLNKSKVTYCHKETGRKRFTIDECFEITNILSNTLKRNLTVDEVFKRF